MFWHEFTGRLEGMLLESKGSWAEAEKAYSSLLEENPFDQVRSVGMVFMKQYIHFCKNVFYFLIQVI